MDHERLRVLLAQTTPWMEVGMGVGHREANLKRAAGLILEFLQAGGTPDLIVFPEFAFDGPGSALLDPGVVVGESAAAIVEGMTPVAVEAGALIIAPAYVADGNKWYNACLAIGPDGVQGEYRKIHPYPPEQSVVRRGYDLSVVSAGRFTVGLQICYDLAFPEPARALALRGADVLVYPTMASDWLMQRFRVLAAARAIENQVFVVVVNAIGVHPTSGDVLGGDSLVAFPNGATQEMGSEEALALYELDGSLLAEERVRLDLLADRAPEVYAGFD